MACCLSGPSWRAFFVRGSRSTPRKRVALFFVVVWWSNQAGFLCTPRLTKKSAERELASVR